MKMKENVLLAAILLLTCPVMAQEKPFIIKGKIGTLNAPATAIISYGAAGKKISDTAVLHNGVFVLKGKVSGPSIGILTFYPKGMKPASPSGLIPGAYGRLLWLEPGTVTVEDSASIVHAVFRSKVNDEQQAYYDATAAAEATGASRADVQLRFIRSHPASPVSLRILYEEGAQATGMRGGIPDVTIAEPLFNSLSPAVKNSPLGKIYRASLDTWIKAGIGKMAPDFAQPDQNGKMVKLSDFKGKYVLVDFWASWCVPCRKENPNLRTQYELYKDKGFTILSISLDGDNHGTKESWLSAIDKDSVGAWFHVCDLTGYDKNAVRIRYGVNSIPESFLISPEGKIIGKSLKGTLLNNKLMEIFAGQTTTQVSNVPVAAISPAEKLLLDTAVRYGKLANGFTYYIRKNPYPKERVAFYLVNKVGAILENEEERGLAHFLEHMNFNGTTHFPKNDMIDYLQKAGVRFGADINAYTSFDETVYQLPIPSDKPDVLQKGIQIMRDWAQEALLDPTEINKERGVVLEEKRRAKGAGERLQTQFLPWLLNDSRYAQRLAIGTDAVLNNFTPATITAFYKKWYRPDLQALIVVGDMDVASMELAVKQQFADLKNPVPAWPRPEYTIPLTGRNRFATFTDPEQTATVVQVIYKRRAQPLLTAGDYRDYVIRNLFNSMLADRVNELTANKSDPPFIAGGAGIGTLLGTVDNYTVNLRPKPGQLEHGFKAIWQMQEQMKRYGFTPTEIDRAKKAFQEKLASSLAEKNTIPSSQLANDYVQHFLKGLAQPGIAREVELANTLMPGITSADFDFLIKEFTGETDRDIMLLAPEKDKTLLPTEKDILRWMEEVASGPLTAYVDQYKANKPFVSKEPVAGKVVSKKTIPGIKAMEWTLSNGARVIIKPTDFVADDITFSAVAPGGNSNYSDADYPSAKYAAFLFTTSGVGDLDATEMNKFLNAKKLGMGLGIADYLTSIEGFTTVKELETFMQLVYLRFAKPRIDRAGMAGMINNFKAALANKNSSPEDEYYKMLSATLFNGNIRGRNEDSAFLDAVDIDKAYRIYNEAFGNAASFTFILAGAVDTAVLQPLVEKYLASLPSNDHFMTVKDLGIHPPPGQLTKILRKGIEQKAKVNLTFSGAFDYTAANTMLLTALKEILEMKLLERIREKESGVYSPSVMVVADKIPAGRYRLRVAFDCAPQNVEKLIASTLDEVVQLKSNGADDTYIQKFKAQERRNRELSLKSNDWWVNYMMQQTLHNSSLEEVNGYEQTLNQVTRETLKAAANQYLSGNNLLRFILLPQETNSQPGTGQLK